VSRLPFAFQYLAPELLAVGLAMISGEYYATDRPWEDSLPASRGVEPDIGSWE
jgi:hypothetical protein